MAMPAVKVEMYSDGYSQWVDVSSYVVMTAGLSLKRGRSSQFDTSSPGTLTLTLSNKDESFSPGNFYGFTLNTSIRVTMSSTIIWTGYVDSYTMPLAAGDNQIVNLSCTDQFKLFAKAPLSAYGIEQGHVLVGSGYASAGATYALEAPTNGVGSFWQAFRNPTASPIRIYGGSAGSHEFQDSGPAFVKSCIRLNVSDNLVGPVLEHPTSFNPGTQTSVVAMWFRTTYAADMYLFDMRRTSGGSGYFSAILQGSSGKITFNASGDSTGNLSHTTTAGNLYDGSWHHLVVNITQSGGNTYIIIYIDGSTDSTHSATGLCSISSTNRRLTFGGLRNSAWTNNSYVFNGSMALLMVYISPSGSATDLRNIYGAGADGDSGDSISTRLTNLSTFIGVGAPTVSNVSALTLSGQVTSGKNYLEAVQDISETERGVFWIDGDGLQNFRGSSARSSSASVVLTIDASQDLDGSLQFTVDDVLFANTVVATGPTGSYTTYDGTSAAYLGYIVDSFNSLASTEALLQSTAASRLTQRMYSSFRLSKVVIDLLSTPNSIITTALALKPLDRVRVSSLPSYAPASSFDGFVEGWELSISDQSYTCSLDLSPVI